MAIAALIMFSLYSFQFFSDMIKAGPSITLNKGSFILPGVVLGLGAFAYVFFLEAISKKPSSKSVTKIFITSEIAGIALIFLLPQIVHHPTESYLVKKGYAVCDEASYQWLHARTIVYTNSPLACADKVAEKVARSH